MEKLTLEHLAPYLPYGLKIQPPDRSTILELHGLCGDLMIFKDPEESYGSIIGGISKPILRPMSDLIREINGRIPFEEIANIEAPNIIDAVNRLTKITPFVRGLSFNSNQVGVYYKYEGVQVEITHYRKSVFHKKVTDGNSSWIFSYFHDYSGIIDLLNRYHFDYKGLIEKGLAISIHDIKN